MNTRRVTDYLWKANTQFFRKQLVNQFEDYITSEEFLKGNMEGKYFVGEVVFRENLHHRAKIISPSFSEPLQCHGQDLNRAIHGSQVVFEVTSENWQKYLVLEAEDKEVLKKKLEDEELEEEDVVMVADLENREGSDGEEGQTPIEEETPEDETPEEETKKKKKKGKYEDELECRVVMV